MASIVVLDGYTMNPGDIDWAPLIELGETAIFPRTSPELVIERAIDADILVVNKVVLSLEILQALPALKCICVMATGYNNIDIAFAKSRGIPVLNAVGYSTQSVAQHVFALILSMLNRVEAHNQSVHTGDWTRNPDFSFQLQPITELAGKKLGIYGFGQIGQKVASIARAHDMQVLVFQYNEKTPASPDWTLVDLETLFSESDILTLHAPLNAMSAGFINLENLRKMKPAALLVNTSRGGLVNENDLAAALQSSIIAGVAVDVLSTEPPSANNPLLTAPRCLITPHHAWASTEARGRLFQSVVQNIKSYLDGHPQNRVNT
jgi:glycerate dehydrogenase